jgi:hypothetical protein
MNYPKVKWLNVTKANPCPICGRFDWCSIHPDGTLVHCKKIKEGSFKTSEKIGWLHRLADKPADWKPVRAKPADTAKEKAAKALELQALCHKYYADTSLNNLRWLAKDLGVSVLSLMALNVCMDRAGKCFVFPERDHRGALVGANRRFKDGSKKAIGGYGRGLTYADDWNDYSGPIYIVEGGSDVAAGLTLGLRIIGRPSCLGGTADLAKLIGPIVSDTRIIILAEDDEKDRTKLTNHKATCKMCTQCWPGKAGAVQLSMELSKRFNRLVQWTFLPCGVKDLRKWLNIQSVDRNNQTACFAAGQALTKILTRNAFKR